MRGGHSLKVDRKCERGPRQKATEVHPVRNWVHPSARCEAGERSWGASAKYRCTDELAV